MWSIGSKAHGERLFQKSQMLKLPREPSHLFKKLQYIQNRKGYQGDEIQKKYNISRSKKNNVILVNTYTDVAQKVSLINNNNRLDKYKALIKKLKQLGQNNWPKFQKLLKHHIHLKWNEKKPQQIPIPLPPHQSLQKILNLQPPTIMDTIKRKTTKIINLLTNSQNKSRNKYQKILITPTKLKLPTSNLK